MHRMTRPTPLLRAPNARAADPPTRIGRPRRLRRPAIIMAALWLALMQATSAWAQGTPPTPAPTSQAAPLYALAIDLSGSTVNCTDKECLSVSAARMNLDLLRPARVVLIPFYGDQANLLGPYNLGNPAEYAAAQDKLAAMCAMRNPNFQTPLAKALDAA